METMILASVVAALAVVPFLIVMYWHREERRARERLEGRFRLGRSTTPSRSSDTFYYDSGYLMSDSSDSSSGDCGGSDGGSCGGGD